MGSNPEKILLKLSANPDIRKAYLDTAEGQVHFWTVGSGQPLLLIHQSSSSTEEYAAMVPFLADHFQLIAYDWPGHGRSDDPPKEYRVDEFTHVALSVLDHLDISKVHVLGHHGGALIAMNLAWRFPERVNKLILSGTSAVKEEAETKAFLHQLKETKGDTFEKNGQTILDTWKRYLHYLPNSIPEEILIPFLHNLNSKLRPYDAHFKLLNWNRRQALESLKDLDVLLCQGELDSFVSQQEKLLDLIPNAKRVIIPDAGMFYFYEKPGDCAEMIHSFLLKA